MALGKEPAIKYQYGPYYESAISKSQPQRVALGQPALSPAQLAGITSGELEARYRADQVSKQHADEMRLKEDALEQEKEQQKAQSTGAIAGAAGTVIGGALGTLIPIPVVGTLGGAAIGGALGSIIGGVGGK